MQETGQRLVPLLNALITEYLTVIDETVPEPLTPAEEFMIAMRAG